MLFFIEIISISNRTVLNNFKVLLIVPIRSSPGPIFTGFIGFDGRDYTPNMHQKH